MNWSYVVGKKQNKQDEFIDLLSLPYLMFLILRKIEY
jgi:hypothetical protein